MTPRKKPVPAVTRYSTPSVPMRTAVLSMPFPVKPVPASFPNYVPGGFSIVDVLVMNESLDAIRLMAMYSKNTWATLDTMIHPKVIWAVPVAAGAVVSVRNVCLWPEDPACIHWGYQRLPPREVPSSRLAPSLSRQVGAGPTAPGVESGSVVFLERDLTRQLLVAEGVRVRLDWH